MPAEPRVAGLPTGEMGVATDAAVQHRPEAHGYFARSFLFGGRICGGGGKVPWERAQILLVRGADGARRYLQDTVTQLLRNPTWDSFPMKVGHPGLALLGETHTPSKA